MHDLLDDLSRDFLFRVLGAYKLVEYLSTIEGIVYVFLAAWAAHRLYKTWWTHRNCDKQNI